MKWGVLQEDESMESCDSGNSEGARETRRTTVLAQELCDPKVCRRSERFLGMSSPTVMLLFKT